MTVPLDLGSVNVFVFITMRMSLSIPISTLTHLRITFFGGKKVTPEFKGAVRQWYQISKTKRELVPHLGNVLIF